MKLLVYDRLGHTAGPVSELVFEDYRVSCYSDGGQNRGLPH